MISSAAKRWRAPRCSPGWRLSAPGSENHAALVNTYGPTEATIVTHPLGGFGLGHSDRAVPIAGSRVYVVDRRSQPVPQGVAGVSCGSAVLGLARGYLGRPGPSRRRLSCPIPFSDVGDIGGERGARALPLG